MDCACDKKIIEIPDFKEKFSTNELFNERLREAQRNIQDRLKDKELNNVFFLTLFEMPYIFCDGKVIAGFQSKYSKKPQKDKKINIGTLSNQPLNTLHMTERVIKTDRFKDDILPKVFLNGHASKQILDAGPGWYEVTYSEKTKMLNYLGLIPVAHNPTWGQYKESDKAKIKVYAFKIKLKNSAYHLYIIWSDGTSQEHSCLKERYNQLSSVLTQIFSKENTVSPLMPYYLDPSVKKDLEDTISFSSIEQKLLSRSYFDRNLDKITDEIYSILELKTKSGNAKGFRCVFLRTKKPDANYFVIQVTPKMLEAMYKEIRETIKKKDGIAFFKDILIKPYKDYYKHFIVKDTSPEKFESLVTEHAVSALINQLRDIDEKSITNDLSKVNIESILNYHKAFCASRNGTYKWPDGYDPKKHENIYFTCLAKSIIENTPLVSGVAYHVGKRGVPDLSINWLKDNKIKHPFGLIQYGEEDKYRYPEYFKKFADTKILKPEGKQQLMLDVPVLHNGILLGVFIVYPSRDRKRNALTFFHKIYPNILKAIDNAKPDLMRALFLDVCANVNTRLSGQNTDSFTPDDLIKETEELIRYAHGMPFTYIIYLSDNLSGGNDKVINYKLSKIIDDGKTKVINTLKEVIRTKKDSFDFCKNSKNGYLEVRKKLDEKENPYVFKHFVSYKYLKLEKWEFLILQLHSKHPDAFSPREENNALYLCQAIETGLRTLEKKHEIIRHGTRAAVAAIMGRNMSHNIGSHVLSYLSEQSIKAINNKLIIESPTIGKAIELDGAYTFGFYKYLQGRSDYIAEISTAQPTWSVNRGLVRDVVEPFVYGGNNRGELLDNIGKSVYYENTKGRKFLNASAIKIIIHKNKKGFTFSCSDNVFSFLDTNGDQFDEKFDTVVDIPHGLLGCHAFYSIMENFIRNSIKHNSMKIIKLLKKDIGITINITIGEEVDGLISVRLTDNVSNWSNKIESDINKYITGEKRYLVKNDGTLIRGGGWGIKEMRISAAWLRNIAPETLQYDNAPKDYPLLKVSNFNKSLCYEFYMLKPLNVLFVGFEDVKDNTNLGIYNVSTIEKLKNLIEKGGLRHRFVVIHHKHNDWIKENRLKLPERVFLVKNDSTHYRTDNGIALIGEDEYKNIIKEPASIKEKLYEKWVNHLFSGSDNLPLIYIVKANSIRFNGLENIEGNNISAIPKISESIVFEHCGPNDSPVKALYWENFSTAAGVNTLGSKLKVFEDKNTSDNEKRSLLYELYESSLAEIVVVDERLYAKLHKKITGPDKKLYELLFPKKIEVVNLTKDNNKLMAHMIAPDGQVMVKDWNRYLKDKVNRITFMSIHQTIIDNIITPSGLKSIKEDKRIRTVVIHSGRGQVNITPGYKFIELSNIEREIVEKIPDKHLLVSLYMALKLYEEGGN